MKLFTAVRNLDKSKQNVFAYYGRQLLSLIQNGKVDIIIKPYDKMLKKQQLRRKLQSKKDEVKSTEDRMSEIEVKNHFDHLSQEIEEDVEEFNDAIYEKLREKDLLIVKYEENTIRQNIKKNETMKFNNIIKEQIEILKMELDKLKLEVKERESMMNIQLADFIDDVKCVARVNQVESEHDRVEVETQTESENTFEAMIPDFEDEVLWASNKLQIERRQFEEKHNTRELKESLFGTIKSLVNKYRNTKLEKFLKQMMVIMILLKI